MSKNIEMERRVMLNKAQYEALLNYSLKYSNRKSFTLVNHYFDDEDLSLRKNHYMLRIRNTDDSNFEVTLKVKGEKGDLEINNPISNEEVNILIKRFSYQNEEITPLLYKVTNKEIKYITSLKTERIEIEFDDFLFVLDKNYYSDIVDYNLEIESSNIEKANEVIKKYCDQYGMQYSKDYQSKSRRAINKALNI